MILASPLLLELPVTPCIYTYLTFHYPSVIALTQEDIRLAPVWKMLQTPKVSTCSSRFGRGPRLDKSYSATVQFRIKQVFGHRIQRAFNLVEIHLLNELFKLQIFEDFLRFQQTDSANCTIAQCNCIREFRQLHGFTEEELPDHELEKSRWEYLARQVTTQTTQPLIKPLFTIIGLHCKTGPK